ncbi:MAG: hypothetical protein AVDCRST_MAG27-4588, partial [uncultured Craurococcus sp.]
CWPLLRFCRLRPLPRRMTSRPPPGPTTCSAVWPPTATRGSRSSAAPAASMRSPSNCPMPVTRLPRPLSGCRRATSASAPPNSVIRRIFAPRSRSCAGPRQRRPCAASS